jgi:hypothetical protein
MAGEAWPGMMNENHTHTKKGPGPAARHIFRNTARGHVTCLNLDTGSIGRSVIIRGPR